MIYTDAISGLVRAVLAMNPLSPQELESVNEDVQAMSTCCEEMTNRLKVR